MHSNPLSSQSPDLGLKSSKQNGLSITEEEDYVIAALPLRPQPSAGEAEGLLKFPSASSDYNGLSRQGSDVQKIEENPNARYADLLGFDAFALTAKVSNAPLYQLHASITDPDSSQDRPGLTANNNSIRAVKKPKAGAYAELICAPEVETGNNHSTVKNAQGSQEDLEAKYNQGHTERMNYEPISDVVSQDVALNIQPESALNSASPDENENQPDSPPPPIINLTPEQIRLLQIAIPEVKLHVKKVMIFFATMILTSLCVLVPVDGLLYFELIILGPFLYAFIWCGIEMHYTVKLVDYLWFDSGEFFKLFDALNVIILILAVQFKLGSILSMCTYASFTFFLSAHAFVFQCKGKIIKNLESIIDRYFYAFQAVFFLLRVDGYSDWDWFNVFFLAWIYFAIKVPCFIVKALIMLYKLTKQNYPKRITKMLGFPWYTIFQGLIFVPIFMLYGFVQYMRTKDFTMVTIVALVNLGVNILLLAYSFVCKRYITTFSLRMKTARSLLFEYELEQEKLKIKTEVTFAVEKKESYFVMLSSTYFLPLHKSFYAKGKESLNKIKSMFSKFRFGSKQKAAHTEEIKTESLADVQKLRDEKVKLDVKMSKIEDLMKLPASRNKDRKQTERLRSRMTRGDLNDLEESSLQNDNKLAMSVDDLDKVKQMEIFPSKPKNNDEEDSCYLCYANPRNVILMNCGHGGICFDCAVSTIKTKNECMECRKEVDAIYMIDPNPKLFDIVKAYEFHKLVITVVPNEELANL